MISTNLKKGQVGTTKQLFYSVRAKISSRRIVAARKNQIMNNSKEDKVNYHK